MIIESLLTCGILHATICLWHLRFFSACWSGTSVCVRRPAVCLQYHIGQASNRSLFHTIVPWTHMSLRHQACVSHPFTSAVTEPLSEQIAVVHHCYERTLSGSKKISRLTWHTWCRALSCHNKCLVINACWRKSNCTYISEKLPAVTLTLLYLYISTQGWTPVDL